MFGRYSARTDPIGNESTTPTTGTDRFRLAVRSALMRKPVFGLRLRIRLRSNNSIPVAYYIQCLPLCRFPVSQPRNDILVQLAPGGFRDVSPRDRPQHCARSKLGGPRVYRTTTVQKNTAKVPARRSRSIVCSFSLCVRSTTIRRRGKHAQTTVYNVVS